MNRREWRWVAWATLVLVIASSLPYLIVWAATPDGARFTGLVFNPQDGNSYIAKMRQGLAGSWSFHLPYTSEPHDGAPVYLFYLFLGHVARWTGLPLIALYHTARVLGGAAMLLALYALASRLSSDVGERRVMFLLAATGSGLGWLAGSLLGVMTSDLWVPEAFPVYALLANAHFPLAMGLMGAIAYCGLRIADRGVWTWGLMMAVVAAALGVIQPFGLVAVFGALGAMLVARAVHDRAVPWRAVAWVFVAGAAALPYPLYMQWALHVDPVLAAWSAQNLTPSPPLWDWALSYGIVLVLAVPGCVFAVRHGSDADRLLLGWVLVTLVGMYTPGLPLQRRLSLGLGLPMGLLAGMGWWRAARLRVRARMRGFFQGLAVAACALTPLLLALMALLAAWGGNPWFYLTGDEWRALAWLRDEGRPDAVVLCAPQTGLFVPAWAGQRVVYGHPFETVDAGRQRAQVEAYWAGEMSPAEQEAFWRENGVEYVWVGPRELEFGGRGLEIGGSVFEAEGVSVYDVRTGE